MPQHRVGGVQIKYKQAIYVFGGSKTTLTGLITEFWDEALVYEINKAKWKTVKYTNDGGTGRAAPRPSKFIAGSLLKDKVVISGGVNHEAEFIDDYWLFFFGKQSLIEINKSGTG